MSPLSQIPLISPQESTPTSPKLKLSPSDFAYLYEECKFCYYQKIKYSVMRPSMAFPAIFGAINTRLQGTLVGRDLRHLSPDLPEGIVESQEGFVESTLLPGTNLYFKGKYDLLIKQPDGTYLIVDFKISQADEGKISKYQTQLQSYKFALENPVSGTPKTITRMGLIIMYPDKVWFDSGKGVLDFPPKWMEIPEDKTSFNKFMYEVNDLLAGSLPEENPNCSFCKYRATFTGDNLPAVPDLPF